jgi:hypothetical protein
MYVVQGSHVGGFLLLWWCMSGGVYTGEAVRI